jgi:hypothetical protein
VECDLCGLTLSDKFVKRRHVSTVLIIAVLWVRDPE